MDFEKQMTFSFPTLIRFGNGVVQELGAVLKTNGVRSPQIVTDPNVAALPFLKKIVTDLKAQGFGAEVYHQLHKNPIKSDVAGGVDFYRQNQCDAIVGIGGGAALDVARAIALKVNHPGDLFDYEDAKGGDRLVTEEIPYFVTIPTTAGTGSEVGRSTVISDDVTHQKKILFSPRLMAKIALIDPGLTMELPPMVTAATGMDALTHHVEAFLAKGWHPMCDGIALEGIRLVGESLISAVKRPNLEVRSKMMMAAFMGAVAFQKGLGVVHSTAHPLSTLFDLHHGLANAIMISYGMEFNADVSEDRLTRIAEVLRIHKPGPDSFIEYLRQLNGEIDLPIKLSSQGVKPSAVSALAELAFADVCHGCNFKKVTQSDFEKIYRQAL